MHVEVPAHVLWAGAYQAALNNLYDTALLSQNQAYLRHNKNRLEILCVTTAAHYAHADHAAQNLSLRAEIEALEEEMRSALRDHSARASLCRTVGQEP
jgi:hypothetical protein